MDDITRSEAEGNIFLANFHPQSETFPNPSFTAGGGVEYPALVI